MKNTLKCSLFLALAGFASQAHAATIAAGGSVQLVAGDVNDPYVISVNSNNSGFANDFSAASNAGYIGTTVTGTFNGAIEGYRFAGVTGGPGARTIISKAESGGIVSLITSTDESDLNGYDSFGQNVQGFTNTDPGAFTTNAAALTAAEVTGGSNPRDFTAGIRDLDDFTGTVDISGISQGSIYLFSGSYNSGALSITATMSDAVLSDINSVELFTGTPVGQQNIYATRIDFVNDLGYDTLTYTSNGSRYVGAVVTSVPEPSSTALLGLVGLVLVLRRRR